jgi:hypothetical protein
MKRHFSLLIFITLLLGCQKTKERIQENMVIKAMTEGQWRITKFTKAGSELTTDFAPYLFQFRSNNTVEALNNGTLEKTGNWSADPNARTITSSFANAATTLMLLNGTWQVTKNSWTFVEASQTVNGEARTLRLDK